MILIELFLTKRVPNPLLHRTHHHHFPNAPPVLSPAVPARRARAQGAGGRAAVRVGAQRAGVFAAAVGGVG
jgi:hypothetical protein